MIKKLIVIALIWIGTSGLHAHPFYVSITEINTNPQTGAFEISIKVFVDDFEKGMEKIGRPELNLGDTTEIQNADSLIFAYINDHFKLKVNEENLSLHFVGKEVENANLWIYIETDDANTEGVLEVYNDILCDVFDTQSNIVHFNQSTAIKSLILSKSNPQGKIF